MIVTGIDTLAPESLPTICRVAVKAVFPPNSVFMVVAVILKLVPITVLDTDVPIVEVEFNACTSGVSTPTPLKLFNSLTSDIVNVYPDVSYA